MFLVTSCVLAVAMMATASSTDDSNIDSVQITPEAILRAKMEGHLSAVDRQIRVLDNFLDTYYKDYDYTEADAKEYVSNPINTYMLIKRTGMEWPVVKAVIFNSTLDQEFKEIAEMSKELNMDK